MNTLLWGMTIGAFIALFVSTVAAGSGYGELQYKIQLRVSFAIVVLLLLLAIVSTVMSRLGG